MAKTKTTTHLHKTLTCSPRAQANCEHPWHFEWFYGKTGHLYPNKGKHRYSLSVLAALRDVPAPTSKDTAQSFAEALKIEIRAGSFRAPRGPVATPPTDPSALTVADVVTRYHRAARLYPDAPAVLAEGDAGRARGPRPHADPRRGRHLIPFGRKPLKDVVLRGH